MGMITAATHISALRESAVLTQHNETLQRCENIAREIEADGPACETMVRFGLPADEIISAAEEHGAELLVMGSHGHGALYHLFSGSVVTGVLKRMDRPVLVVPLREKSR
jgi:nucleotide-binding universal stress UspA family protein